MVGFVVFDGCCVVLVDFFDLDGGDVWVCLVGDGLEDWFKWFVDCIG